MTNPGTHRSPRRVAGRDPVPKGQCPRCLSPRILGPRVVKAAEEWCNCYNCGHEWRTNKVNVRKDDKPKRAYHRKDSKPKLALAWKPKAAGR